MVLKGIQPTNSINFHLMHWQMSIKDDVTQNK